MTLRERAEAPRNSEIALRSAQGRWVMAATILGSGIAFLDGTVVTVALPTIQKDLAAPLSGLQWIVDAYALFLAALLLVGGSLGDRYGRKRIFLAGLVLFTLASAICALAPSLDALIAARAVQGVGGALLVPASLAIIKAVIADRDTGQAIGLWTGLSGVTSAAGPLVGGYLIGAVSWRAIFFINVPLAIAAIALTALHMPENEDPGAARLDFAGAVSTVLGLGGLTFGLIEGPERGWGSLLVTASLVVGVIGLLLFPLIETRVRHPMVPLGLFRSPDFSGSNLVTLFVYFCFSGVLFFLILDLQQIGGFTPLQAGASLLPITVMMLVLSPMVGRLLPRIGPRLPMTAGSLLIAAGFLLFLRLSLHVSYFTDLLLAIVILGLGMSIFVTPLTATVMSSVPAHSVGTASGVNNAVARVAGLLAIAILGAVVASRFDVSLRNNLDSLHLPASARTTIIAHESRLGDTPIPQSLPATQQAAARSAVERAFVDGFHWDMGICFILLLLSAAISALVIRRLPQQ